MSAESASRARGRVAVLVDEIAEQEAEIHDMAAPAQSTHRIIAALRALGYEPVELVLREGDVADWVGQLASRAESFDFAFNLCETVAGRAEGEHLAAAAVELLELPMTGARSRTLLYCLNKDRCAAMLRSHGIPVPDWMLMHSPDQTLESWRRFPAIIKPASDDASNGVHPDSVAHSHEELYAAARRILSSWRAAVIQEFITGREINLAIVGNCLLPPSEIDFSSLPQGSPPIVSFAAKWKAGSPEDLGTRPICPAALDPQVARELQLLAARAWSIMEGRGYGRVDIRLADNGTPYVIDINPNPDLSVDAGLARQARVAGWSYDELIARIVEIARSPNGAGQADADWVFVPPRTEEGLA